MLAVGRDPTAELRAAGHVFLPAGLRAELYVIESNGGFGFSQIYSIVGLSDGDDDELGGFSGMVIADSDRDGFKELIFASGNAEVGGAASNAGHQLFIYEATGTVR